MSGFGADAPTDNAHKKHGVAVLFIFSSLDVGTAVRGSCFKGLFVKIPLKIRKNFPRLYQYILAKFLKFQETFLEKFLVSGFGADSPN